MGYRKGVIQSDNMMLRMGGEGFGSYDIRCPRCGEGCTIAYYYDRKRSKFPKFCPYCGEPLTEEGSE